MDAPGYDHVGVSDCGYVAVPAWAKKIGRHRVVVIRRRIGDVRNSLKAVIEHDIDDYLEELDFALNDVEGLHVPFDSINDSLEQIHDHLGIPGYDPRRAELFKTMNITSENWRA